MLASVLGFAKDLARLGDPDLALELALDGEEGTRISLGVSIGCGCFLGPGGRPRFFPPISCSFTGSPCPPVLPDIFFALLLGFLTAALRPSFSSSQGALRIRGLAEVSARYRE